MKCIPMSWIFLFFAGLFEIGWAIGLKYTDGFSKPLPTVLTVASMIVSLGLLGLALKTLPVGTAYAVWTGIGTVGTALLGIWLLGEPATAIRLGCIALIVCGIMGLKLAAWSNSRFHGNGDLLYLCLSQFLRESATRFSRETASHSSWDCFKPKQPRKSAHKYVQGRWKATLMSDRFDRSVSGRRSPEASGRCAACAPHSVRRAWPCVRLRRPANGRCARFLRLP
jgi:quaternary ammonium compound-resistance protein SugE